MTRGSGRAPDPASFEPVLRSSSRPAARPALLLVGALLLAVAVLVGVRAGSGATAATPPAPAKRFADGSCQKTAIRFGIVLAPGDRAGRAAADVLTRDIAQQLGCPAITVPRASQSELVSALALHQVDLAQIDPAAVTPTDRLIAAVPLGAYTTGRETPARTRPSRLWTRADGPQTLRELRPDAVELGPELTAAGDVLPRTALLGAGVAVGRATAAGAPTPVRRAADDASGLRDLRRGRVEAAVTVGPVSRSASRGLRQLWASEPVLADVVVIRPGIPNAVRRLIVAAVRDLPSDALAPLAARQGIANPMPLLTVPLDLYAQLGWQQDALTAAGLHP